MDNNFIGLLWKNQVLLRFYTIEEFQKFAHYFKVFTADDLYLFNNFVNVSDINITINLNCKLNDSFISLLRRCLKIIYNGTVSFDNNLNYIWNEKYRQASRIYDYFIDGNSLVRKNKLYSIINNNLNKKGLSLILFVKYLQDHSHSGAISVHLKRKRLQNSYFNIDVSNFFVTQFAVCDLFFFLLLLKSISKKILKIVTRNISKKEKYLSLVCFFTIIFNDTIIKNNSLLKRCIYNLVKYNPNSTEEMAFAKDILIFIDNSSKILFQLYKIIDFKKLTVTLFYLKSFFVFLRWQLIYFYYIIKS